jgi:hypothetical protein
MHNMSRNPTNNNQDEFPITPHDNNPEHMNEEAASGRGEPDDAPDRMVSHESISHPASQSKRIAMNSQNPMIHQTPCT